MGQQLVDAYNENVATPYSAAERGYIDAVIEPSATRLEIRRALTLLRDKRQALRPRRAEAPPDSALTAVGSHSCTVVR